MQGDYLSGFYGTDQQAMTSLSVCECGWQHSGKGFPYGPAIRSHFVIHYIVSGRGIYEVEGENYHLSAGDGFVIRPGERTLYRADEEDPWHYYWVGFLGSDAPRLLSLAGLSGRVFSYQKDQMAQKHLADIYFASQGYSSRAFAMIGHLYLFFSCLIQEHVRRESPTEETVGRAVRWMEEQLAEPITIVEVAHAVGVERSTLYRMFEQSLGKSPKAYLRALRVFHAERLLEQGLTVERVGEAVGYNNPAHFSKVFKQERALSPRAWRKKQESLLKEEE